MEKIKDNSIILVDLDGFQRELPPEVEKVLLDCIQKKLFDTYLILCTDYTRKVTATIKKENQKKDPILFGAFINNSGKVITQRLYVLAEWEDEYCDLTMDKLLDLATKQSISLNLVNFEGINTEEEVKSIVESSLVASSKRNSFYDEEDEYYEARYKLLHNKKKGFGYKLKNLFKKEPSL